MVQSTLRPTAAWIGCQPARPTHFGLRLLHRRMEQNWSQKQVIRAWGQFPPRQNSGANWSSNNVPSLFWEGVASSADGNKLVAVATSGQIYTSTNSGANWLQRIATGFFWTSVASSTDGTKLVAADNGGGIYISTNSGVSWNVTSASTNYWDSVASSADGSKLVSVSDGQETGKPGLIITSTNSGITWITNNAPISFYWSSVASSADGNRLAATPYGNPIYTLQITPSPRLNMTSYSNNMTFSWLVPSTNF